MPHCVGVVAELAQGGGEGGGVCEGEAEEEDFHLGLCGRWGGGGEGAFFGGHFVGGSVWVGVGNQSFGRRVGSIWVVICACRLG